MATMNFQFVFFSTGCEKIFGALSKNFLKIDEISLEAEFYEDQTNSMTTKILQIFGKLSVILI